MAFHSMGNDIYWNLAVCFIEYFILFLLFLKFVSLTNKHEPSLKPWVVKFVDFISMFIF